MICEFCEGKTKKRRVKKSHWYGGKLYLLENVEAEVCEECGERYYHAKVLEEIDNTLKVSHPVKEHLSVEVVRM